MRIYTSYVKVGSLYSINCQEELFLFYFVLLFIIICMFSIMLCSYIRHSLLDLALYNEVGEKKLIDYLDVDSSQILKLFVGIGPIEI